MQSPQIRDDGEAQDIPQARGGWARSIGGVLERNKMQGMKDMVCHRQPSMEATGPVYWLRRPADSPQTAFRWGYLTIPMGISPSLMVGWLIIPRSSTHPTRLLGVSGQVLSCTCRGRLSQNAPRPARILPLDLVAVRCSMYKVIYGEIDTVLCCTVHVRRSSSHERHPLVAPDCLLLRTYSTPIFMGLLQYSETVICNLLRRRILCRTVVLCNSTVLYIKLKLYILVFVAMLLSTVVVLYCTLLSSCTNCRMGWVTDLPPCPRRPFLFTSYNSLHAVHTLSLADHESP
jgi:hypothetical protein